MKKTLFTLFAFVAALNAHSQENINYYPFCYEGKWGIADTHKNEVAAPNASDVDFLEKSEGLIFMEDDKGKNYFFSVTNGTKTETRGAVRSQLTIANRKYFLMASDKGDYLYSLATKKEYPQQLKYKFMYSQKLTDEKGKAHNYVVGYLAKGKIVVLDGNSPQLKQLVPGSFDAISFVTLNDTEYGMVLKKGAKYLGYGPTLVQAGTINSDAEYLFYEDDANEKVKKMFGRDVGLLSDIDFEEIVTSSEGLTTTEDGDTVTLGRENNGTAPATVAVIRNPEGAAINFDEFKGMELFRLIKNWKPVFAGVLKVVDGRKELMVPAKYTGLQ